MMGPRNGRLHIQRADGIVAMCTVVANQAQGVKESPVEDGFYVSTPDGRTVQLWMRYLGREYRLHSERPASTVAYTMTDAELNDKAAYKAGLRALLKAGSDNSAVVKQALEYLLRNG